MKRSAGLLIYRTQPDLEVLLVHPGGPFWKNRDIGAWSIPKGEFSDGQDPLTCAMRELHEETGFTVKGEFRELGSARLKSGKVIYAWAIEGNPEPTQFVSNTFLLEWPPKSKRMIEVPEVDQVKWFSPAVATEKLNPAQVIFVTRLESLLFG